MSDEPVGNGPRMNIPGNSHKQKTEKAAAEPAPRVKAEKAVEGKVVVRKQPWYKKAVRSMVAEDATNVGDYLLVDVVVPAVKTLILNIVSQGAERALYGSSRPKTRGGGSSFGSSLRTRYHDAPTERPRVLDSRTRATHDFGQIILETREEAVNTIALLDQRIDEYGSVTVADLYDILGVSGSYMDQKWGWVTLREADVRQHRDGWRLDLPPTEPIR